ncbi:hypothetical protein BJ912DRAFT_1055722 [Pholiota molesta]|nr:hypothetical protein BJ912DRAFT_1055722 [Pholiota molesta]
MHPHLHIPILRTHHLLLQATALTISSGPAAFPAAYSDRMQGGMSGSSIANLTDTTNMATRGGGSDTLLGGGGVPWTQRRQQQ